jgi:hypothetical protein
MLRTTRIFRILPIAVGFCLLAKGVDAASSDAITEIRAVIQAQQGAWNRGDIDGFMNGYARARSTVFVSEDTVTRGWQTVRDRYKKRYSDREKMGTLTFSDWKSRRSAARPLSRSDVGN